MKKLNKKGMALLLVMVFMVVSYLVYWGLLRINNLIVQRSKNYQDYYRFDIQEMIAKNHYQNYVDENVKELLEPQIKEKIYEVVKNQANTIDRQLKLSLGRDFVFEWDVADLFYGYSQFDYDGDHYTVLYQIDLFLDEESLKYHDDLTDLEVSGQCQRPYELTVDRPNSSEDWIESSCSELEGSGYHEFHSPITRGQWGSASGFVPKLAIFDYYDSQLWFDNRNIGDWYNYIYIAGSSNEHDIELDKTLKITKEYEYYIRVKSFFYRLENAVN